MAIFRFSHGQRFRWNSEDFVVTRVFMVGNKDDQNPAENIYVEFSDEQGEPQSQLRTLLEQEFLEGRLTFRIESPNDSPVSKFRTGATFKTLDDYDPDLVEVARWRKQVIEPLKLKKDRTSADVRNRVAEVKAGLTIEQQDSSWYRVSRSTIYEWLRLDQQFDGDIRALIPDVDGRGGRGRSRLDQSAEEIMINVITDLVLNSKLGAPLSEVVDEIELRIKEQNIEREKHEMESLTAPKKTTVWSRIKKLQLEKSIEKYRTRENRSPHVHIHGKSKRELPPTGEIEIDTTRLDIIAANDERTVPIGSLNLVSAVDKAIDYPFGRYIGFEPESHYASLECLYHGILPKYNVREIFGTQHEWLSQGIPQLVRIDRGKGYNNKHVRDAAELLGFELDVLKPRTPWLKPFVENHFKVTNDGFHYLDGTTFSNFAKRGDYDSLQAAVFTCFEIDMLLHQFMLDIVAESPLRGVTGITRASMWQERTKPPFEFRRPESAAFLKIALGWVDYRKIDGQHGIEIEYIRYNSRRIPRLAAIWAGEKAKIKSHRGDKSRIYVYDPEGKTPEEQYVEIPAVDQEYTRNLSSWQHRIILNYLTETRREVDRTRLAEARRVVRATMEKARYESRSVRERQRAARFFSTPPSTKSANAPDEADVAASNEDTIPMSYSPSNIVLKDHSLQTEDEQEWQVIRPWSAKIRLNRKENN